MYTKMAFGGDGTSEAGVATLKLGGETMLSLTCDTAMDYEAVSDDFSIAIGLKPALIGDGNMHGFVEHHTCDAPDETWAPLLTVETDSASSTPLPHTLSTAVAAFPFLGTGNLDVTGPFTFRKSRHLKCVKSMKCHEIHKETIRQVMKKQSAILAMPE